MPLSPISTFRSHVSTMDDDWRSFEDRHAPSGSHHPKVSEFIGKSGPLRQFTALARSKPSSAYSRSPAAQDDRVGAPPLVVSKMIQPLGVKEPHHDGRRRLPPPVDELIEIAAFTSSVDAGSRSWSGKRQDDLRAPDRDRDRVGVANGRDTYQHGGNRERGRGGWREEEERRREGSSTQDRSWQREKRSSPSRRDWREARAETLGIRDSHVDPRDHDDSAGRIQRGEREQHSDERKRNDDSAPGGGRGSGRRRSASPLRDGSVGEAAHDRVDPRRSQGPTVGFRERRAALFEDSAISRDSRGGSVNADADTSSSDKFTTTRRREESSSSPQRNNSSQSKQLTRDGVRVSSPTSSPSSRREYHDGHGASRRQRSYSPRREGEGDDGRGNGGKRIRSISPTEANGVSRGDDNDDDDFRTRGSLAGQRRSPSPIVDDSFVALLRGASKPSAGTDTASASGHADQERKGRDERTARLPQSSTSAKRLSDLFSDDGGPPPLRTKHTDTDEESLVGQRSSAHAVDASTSSAAGAAGAHGQGALRSNQDRDVDVVGDVDHESARAHLNGVSRIRSSSPMPAAPIDFAAAIEDYREALMVQDSWPVHPSEVAMMSAEELVELDAPGLIDHDTERVVANVKSTQVATRQALQAESQADRMVALVHQLLAHGLGRELDDDSVSAVLERGLRGSHLLD